MNEQIYLYQRDVSEQNKALHVLGEGGVRPGVSAFLSGPDDAEFDARKGKRRGEVM